MDCEQLFLAFIANNRIWSHCLKNIAGEVHCCYTDGCNQDVGTALNRWIYLENVLH